MISMIISQAYPRTGTWMQGRTCPNGALTPHDPSHQGRHRVPESPGRGFPGVVSAESGGQSQGSANQVAIDTRTVWSDPASASIIQEMVASTPRHRLHAPGRSELSGRPDASSSGI